jgi:hypothetical membrane protein
MNNLTVGAAVLAVTSAVAATVMAGAAIEGYSQLVHPASLLGARQLGQAGVLFGLFAFVLPGLVGAWLGLRLRAVLPASAGWAARIGAQLVLLAALGFAAQGVLPLDLEGLDAGSSRLHAMAWLLWALALPCGTSLLWLGLRAQAQWRRLAWLSLGVGGLVLVAGFLGSGWLGAAISQRLAMLAWLAWGVAVAGAVSRPFSRGAA